MATRGQLTGMQAVFLVAAELSARGFIVTTTSRNAMGADLLVTDPHCQRTWSIQVKANRKPASFWLVGEKSLTTQSPSHVYVFVNLRPADGKHEYYIAPSRSVARRVKVVTHRRSTWYVVNKRDMVKARDRWQQFRTRVPVGTKT
jgi:hypothetical protein